MKKILIWDYEIPLKDSGGPSGYLNNIYRYIKANQGYDNFYFLSEILDETVENKVIDSVSQDNENILKKAIKKLVPTSLRRLKILYKYTKWKEETRLPLLKKIYKYTDFDIIHFHFTYHLAIYHSALKSLNYKGTFILTTHSPQPVSHELLSLTSNKFISNLIRSYIEKEEALSWTLADYIMFPVKEAINVYNSNHYLKELIDRDTSKFKFCPTGITEIYQTHDIDIRKQLNLPKDAFIVSYIGRHNEIKGYSELKKIGMDVLSTNNDIYFVIAGREEPIKGLDHNRWIELGWIDYGNELMGQSDLFILPNKDTYFDLIALEALRVGVPILMTLTGGNRYFQRNYESPGLMYYQYGDNHNAKDIILSLIEKKKNGSLNKMREFNKCLFYNDFTTKTFIDRYLEVCNSLN